MKECGGWRVVSFDNNYVQLNVWSWLGLESFRSSERGQAKQSEVASQCEESLTTDACYIDDDDDEDDDDDNDADLCRQRWRLW